MARRRVALHVPVPPVAEPAAVPSTDASKRGGWFKSLQPWPVQMLSQVSDDAASALMSVATLRQYPGERPAEVNCGGEWVAVDATSLDLAGIRLAGHVDAVRYMSLSLTQLNALISVSPALWRSLPEQVSAQQLAAASDAIEQEMNGVLSQSLGRLAVQRTDPQFAEYERETLAEISRAAAVPARDLTGVPAFDGSAYGTSRTTSAPERLGRPVDRQISRRISALWEIFALHDFLAANEWRRMPLTMPAEPPSAYFLHVAEQWDACSAEMRAAITRESATNASNTLNLMARAWRHCYRSQSCPHCRGGTRTPASQAMAKSEDTSPWS